MGLLDGRVAIITGGGKGIGYGIACKMAEHGANIFITGRTEGRLQESCKKLAADYGVQTGYAVADGGKEEDVKNAVAECVKQMGKLDILVNNAQASKSGVPLIEHSLEDFDLSIDTGLHAAFFYMKHAYPELKMTKGCVINLASGAGLFGRMNQSSYAAAKEGIRGMSRVVATEWGPDGIRVNCLCPLAMTEQLIQWKEEYPESFAGIVKSIPLGRYGDPKEDIGGVAVFLASDLAQYVSGETIVAQGGSGLRP
jgi:NAD(P)-dependent dehydrogenase (short-subunit alcohol dehydrogenase family)